MAARQKLASDHLLRSATPFRLFSSTPILPLREERLGWDRKWRRPRGRRADPEIGSTADQYFALTKETVSTSTTASLKSTTSDDLGSGPSTATHGGELTRSFIFDLPESSSTYPGYELVRQRRLRMYHEKLLAQKTVAQELEEAKWFADPWWRMRKSPPRMCIVTRAQIPNAFLVGFKPIHRPVEEVMSADPGDTLKASEDALSDATSLNLELPEEDEQLGDESSDSLAMDAETDRESQDGISSGDKDAAIGRPQADLEANDDTELRRRVKYNPEYAHPPASLVPHGILHPRVAPQRGGKSVWTAIRKDVVGELSLPGFQTHQLQRLARRMDIPKLLVGMVESQLHQRVVQELEILVRRIIQTGALPQGRVRKPDVEQTVPRGTKVGIDDLEREENALPYQEDLPNNPPDSTTIPKPTATAPPTSETPVKELDTGRDVSSMSSLSGLEGVFKQLGVDPQARVSETDLSWMTRINADRTVLHRLSTEDAKRVDAGEAYDTGPKHPDVVALLDIRGLESPYDGSGEAVPPNNPSVSDGTDVQDPIVSMERDGKGGRPNPEAGKEDSRPRVSMVPLVGGVDKGDIPMFHICSLLPRRYWPVIRQALNHALALESSIRDRICVTGDSPPERSPLKADFTPAGERGSGDGFPEEGGRGGEKGGMETGILALNAWPAPKALKGRRGDLGVPLFIALYRLRLWHGEGWSERQINAKGHVV